jgi:hypothetical protein
VYNIRSVKVSYLYCYSQNENRIIHTICAVCLIFRDEMSQQARDSLILFPADVSLLATCQDRAFSMRSNLPKSVALRAGLRLLAGASEDQFLAAVEAAMAARRSVGRRRSR